VILTLKVNIGFRLRRIRYLAETVRHNVLFLTVTPL